MARRSVTTATEEQTTETPAPEHDDHDRRVLKLEDVVWFLLAVVMAIILVRFILLLLGARTGVPFVDFWYGLSAPLITPFAGMFGNLNTYNVYTGSRLELEAIIAMLVYGLVGYIIVLAIRLFKKEPN